MSDDKNQKLVKQFEQRLAQTISWCSARVDVSNPKDCLRTLGLRPRIFEESRLSAVETVAIERERYGGTEIRKAQIPANLGNGRLLGYFPDASLSCGASEVESEGFFDADNVPAWDTWVLYFENGEHDISYGNCLISWIPPQLIELVSNGIDVNPEECIVWLSKSDVSFAKVLERKRIYRENKF